MVWGLTTVPRVPLDESCLAAFDTLSPTREGVTSDMNSLSRHRVDSGAYPEPVPRRLDFEIVSATVHSIPLEAARDSRATVSSIRAIGVCGSGSSDEAGEDAM